MRLFTSMLKNATNAHMKLCYHLNLNLLVFHVDTTSKIEKNDLSKIQRKEVILIKRIKYAEHCFALE